MASVKLLKQGDETGCGIACVAMVANSDYETTKAKMMEIENWHASKKKFYTRACHLQKLLEVINVKSAIKSSKKWDDIKGCAIVGVNREKNEPFHWVVVIKDASRFIIIDPEQGEIFWGGEWADKENSYTHSKRSSHYISIQATITSITL